MKFKKSKLYEVVKSYIKNNYWQIIHVEKDCLIKNAIYFIIRYKYNSTIDQHYILYNNKLNLIYIRNSYLIRY